MNKNTLTSDLVPSEAVALPPNVIGFTIGQIFVLNGVRMKIRKITKRDVILRPVRIDGDGRREW